MGNTHSGGVITYNLREGYRSEYIAHFIFSSFGPANPYPREDDFGLDLICNLAEIHGKVMKIRSAYGVQVKSEGSGFEFKGKDALLWLNSLEFPLLLAEISKERFTIKIYTTWNINRLLPSIDFANPVSIPERVLFVPSSAEELEFPDIQTGTIPVGKPILEFKLDDLVVKINRDHYWKVLKEWIDIDYNNFRFRRVGIMSSYGYLTWSTNKSIEEEPRKWHKNFYYSPKIYEGIKTLLSEAFIINGLYCKESYKSINNDVFKDEFNFSKNFVDKYLSSYMSDFGKGVFEKKIE